MRALVIGDQESIVAEVRQILSASNRGFLRIDVATLGGALDAFSEADRDLTVLVFPAEPELALPLLSVLCNGAQSSVFVVGPTRDAKFILRVLRLGADEYLDQAELQAELAASLDSIKTTSSPEAASKGRVVGVLSAGGGAGGSTLSANLAVLLAGHHVPMVGGHHVPMVGRSVLIDLRLARPIRNRCWTSSHGIIWPICAATSAAWTGICSSNPWPATPAAPHLLAAPNAVERYIRGHAARRAPGAGLRPRSVPLRARRS